mgnify:CR=1 FL=1
MSNDYFSFKQFTVRHDRCAMKVGTDGVLVGAWAVGGRRILDIGTGTGLIALMMAQRYPEAAVDAVDIDADACAQAAANVAASPFAGRVRVVHAPLQDFVGRMTEEGVYDAIVSNPPYFVDSLKNPDAKRSLARHTDTLSFADLFRCVARLLAPDGHFSVVIPTDRRSDMKREAFLNRFRTHRELFVKTVERKQSKRLLMDFSRSPIESLDLQEEVMQGTDGRRSEWYDALTRDFYLDM